MKLKPRFQTDFWAAAVALLVVAPAAFAQDLSKDTKQQVLDSMSKLITNSAYVPGVDFGKWNDYLDKQKKDIDAAKTEQEFSMAVNGALHEFGFSHIVLITPQAVQARRDSQAVGIGITVQLQPEGLVIYRVVPNTPAQEGHLVAGDIIVEGNGKKPTAVTDLLGKIGQPLTIKVKKTNGKLVSLHLVRRKFSTIQPDTLTWVNKDTAQIAVHTFDLNYDPKAIEDFVSKIEDPKHPAKHLIVDLRNNGGGAVTNLMHLMSLVLPPDSAIGTFVSKSVVNRFVEQTGGNPTDLAGIAKWTPSKLRTERLRVHAFTGNIAVLVNGGSGSASEIAAAALHDIVEAPIVGTKSAGAVLVSVLAPLPNDYMLQFPLSDYVTISGVRLEGTGVIPDVVAKDPRIPGPKIKDEPVLKATDLLSHSTLRAPAASH